MLEIANVTKNFGGLTALNDICIQVKENQIYGLIGPNGAGKTTLFNLIAGFLTATEGSIQFSGKELTRLRPNKIARLGIARTFQNIRLFGTMTVRENVLVAQNTRARSGVLSLVQLLSAREKQFQEEANVLLKKMGLWKKRNEPSISLAYGDQRRLEIARALALAPKLLLLDEPAAGMNEAETEDLLGRIQEIRDMGRTVMLIEHDMKVVMGICDYISVLNFGSLIAQGAPEEIQASEAVIEAYLGREEE
ncbi:MAG: ABC transporter ATP-binding protein [Desulfobacterales bacterium]|jgi:branched-chain amino acid transport system ATP-binding protein|nr:ABC transporter ATP-binding protein [Desulfobacterales bacterium]MDP6808500.1 ABC transporter ATP-binding protein [Desulfobacterales bacterium]|tara:strand:- start:35747 stop:36496 length:750 start_codon:yes stop_codon:yes gene_type:complete